MSTIHGDSPTSDPSRCAHCETRINPQDAFTFRDRALCVECTGAFVSWLLDGGMVEDPAMYAHVMTPQDGAA